MLWVSGAWIGNLTVLVSVVLLFVTISVALFVFFKQKTAYEMDGGLEFRRVLFRSHRADRRAHRRRSPAVTDRGRRVECGPREPERVDVGDGAEALARERAFSAYPRRFQCVAVSRS